MSRLLYSVVAASLVGLLLVPLSSAPAAELERCGPKAAITTPLKHDHMEELAATAILDGNMALEIYRSKSGTWTALATDTRGVTCILGIGWDWEDVDGLFQPLELPPDAKKVEFR